MNFLKKISALTALTALLLLVTSNVAMADELDTLKEKGVIRIAMTGAYPPLNFVNQKNEVVGFDPEIGKEIGKRMGLEVKIVTTAWDGIIAGLLANKYDAIVGSMTITDQRKKVVDFVGPYYRTYRAIFVKKGSSISKIEDLKGLKIGVTLGETHEKWAKAHESWEVKTYKGLPSLLMELDNGRVDAIVNDSLPILLAIKKNDAAVTSLDVPGMEAIEAGIGIRKGNQKLKDAMQKALDDMQADGTYLKIANKWIGADIR